MFGYDVMISLTQLTQLPCYNRVTIPEAYLDVMGHMNVRWYVAMFDDAAWDFFADFGMDQAYYDGTNSGGFALRQYISYLAEVRVGETVAVRTRMLARSAKLIHFMHFMINETTGVLAATMEVLGAHANLEERRLSPFPPQVAAQIDEMLAENGRLDWAAPVCGVIKVT